MVLGTRPQSIRNIAKTQARLGALCVLESHSSRKTSRSDASNGKFLPLQIVRYVRFLFVRRERAGDAFHADANSRRDPGQRRAIPERETGNRTPAAGPARHGGSSTRVPIRSAIERRQSP